jgi:hypothetical protein
VSPTREYGRPDIADGLAWSHTVPKSRPRLRSFWNQPLDDRNRVAAIRCRVDVVPVVQDDDRARANTKAPPSTARINHGMESTSRGMARLLPSRCTRTEVCAHHLEGGTMAKSNKKGGSSGSNQTGKSKRKGK